MSRACGRGEGVGATEINARLTCNRMRVGDRGRAGVEVGDPKNMGRPIWLSKERVKRENM